MNRILEYIEDNNYITIYRGIVAESMEQAYKYIKKGGSHGGKDHGKGIYWTRDIEVAKTYGNYIFKCIINISQAKKLVDNQDIVVLDERTNRSISPDIVEYIDIESKYDFNPRLWDERTK